MRAGQTEATVDFAPRRSGSLRGDLRNHERRRLMARMPQLIEFCKLHEMKLVSIADLIRYRMQHERYVKRVAAAPVSTAFGEFQMIAYASETDHETHVALVRGDLSGARPPLARVHSHCLTGDVFESTSCDCHQIIRGSLEAIAQEGRGVFIYLHYTGRGFGIDPNAAGNDGLPRLVYHMRDRAVDSDLSGQRRIQRESGIGAQILIDLGFAAHSRAHQSPAQTGRAGRLWPGNYRASAASDPPAKSHAPNLVGLVLTFYALIFFGCHSSRVSGRVGVRA